MCEAKKQSELFSGVGSRIMMNTVDTVDTSVTVDLLKFD